MKRIRIELHPGETVESMLQKALACLEAKDIGAHKAMKSEYHGGAVIWLHSDSDMRDALKILKEQKMSATNLD
jgi:hypothetical protein